MPSPRSATEPVQSPVAVLTREVPGFSPYAVSDYSRPRLPYPPLMGAPTGQRRSLLPKLLITLGALLAVGFVAAAVLGIQDRNATKNALIHTSIQFPAEVAGLNKITGPEADKLAALGTAQSSGCGCAITYQTAGYSLADGTPRAVIVIGKVPVGSDLAAGIAAEERGFTNGEAAKGEPVTVFTDVDAGSLGGRMQCGNKMISTVSMTVCMFVDRAVVGSVAAYDGHDGDASQDLTLAHQLRAAIETRS